MEALTRMQTRFVPGSVEGIIRSLEWAGLEYDYGAWNAALSLGKHA